MAFKSLSLFSSVAANQATWKGKPIGVSTSRQTLFGQIAHLPGGVCDLIHGEGFLFVRSPSQVSLHRA